MGKHINIPMQTGINTNVYSQWDLQFPGLDILINYTPDIDSKPTFIASKRGFIEIPACRLA